MISKHLSPSLLVLLSLVSLAACTEMRGPEVAPAASETPAVTDTSTATTSTTTATIATGSESAVPVDVPAAPAAPVINPAVVALLDSANADASAGRLPTATASIERALRIEPRNPVLWQKLAMLKLQKGEYQQAESLAARSNSWAGANKALQAKNWQIISEARSLRGDNAGAKAALARAKALE